MNIRGQIMPVIDLKKILQLPDQGLGELNKVIILSHDQIEFGILADTVHGTQSLEIDKIKEVPVTISGSEKTYLMGITLDGLIILDARKFISDKKLVVNQEVN
jgi:purine-binding chemotaxis protein CheW